MELPQEGRDATFEFQALTSICERDPHFGLPRTTCTATTIERDGTTFALVSQSNRAACAALAFLAPVQMEEWYVCLPRDE